MAINMTHTIVVLWLRQTPTFPPKTMKSLLIPENIASTSSKIAEYPWGTGAKGTRPNAPMLQRPF
jgi:hypothetical protein